MHAARDLAWVEGYRDAGADRLIAFTKDLGFYDRLQAAKYLAALRRGNVEGDDGDVR